MQEKYRLRFFFDAGSGICFWTANKLTEARFKNYPVQAEALPLSPKTIEQINQIATWYDRSLNWDYPPDPSPWRQEEWDRFNRAVKDLLDTVRQELGDSFEISNEYTDGNEDPDLDEYLRTGQRPNR
jgi:hypothetical protein